MPEIDEENTAAGYWTDIDLGDVGLSELTSEASITADGTVRLAGRFPPWSYIARFTLPPRIRTAHRTMILAVLGVTAGEAGIALVNSADTDALQQKVAPGTGISVLLIDVPSGEDAGSIVVRHMTAQVDVYVAVEVIALQWAVVAPAASRTARGLRVLRGGGAFKQLGVGEQHPALRDMVAWTGENEAGFSSNWLGAKTSLSHNLLVQAPPQGLIQCTLPPLDEEYFEYVDVVETVRMSRNSFTMVELGAGYGRWMINAWAALKMLGKADLKTYFIGVEAEPTHFRFMKEHFQANGLDPDQHRLVQAAVSGNPGKLSFTVGQAGTWYGQAIMHTPVSATALAEGQSVVEVDCITLSEVLEGIAVVDLLDMDVQGEELAVCEASREVLNAKVRRVHIGTHTKEVEAGLRRLFTELGWSCSNDYSTGTVGDTPFGPVRFGDGVQTWHNPSLMIPAHRA